MPVSTVVVAIFLRQQFRHIELDGQAKADAGMNVLGSTDSTTGVFQYESRAIAALRDAKLDPRTQVAVAGDSGIVLEVGQGGERVEPSAPFGLTQLQVQLADAY